MMFGCCSLKTREARKFAVKGDFRELTESYEFTNDEEVFRDGEWQDAGWKDLISMKEARQVRCLYRAPKELRIESSLKQYPNTLIQFELINLIELSSVLSTGVTTMV